MLNFFVAVIAIGLVYGLSKHFRNIGTCTKKCGINRVTGRTSHKALLLLYKNSKEQKNQLL